MAELKEIPQLLIDKEGPNKFHPETGLYLLWSDKDRDQLIDWESFCASPSRGLVSDAGAYNLLMMRARAANASLVKGRGWE